MELRTYQIELAKKAASKLKEHQIVYMAMEVRTGKTLTSLLAAHFIHAKNVLFLTKRLARESIKTDFKSFNFNYKITVTNYEKLHKLIDNYDVIICDEAHLLGAFPKPTNRTILLKKIISKTNAKVIYLSGTPNPESYCQLFHQFWVTGRGPWSQYINFYKWAATYVNIKTKFISGFQVRDYSQAHAQLVKTDIAPYLITFSQQEAGFTKKVFDCIEFVKMDDSTYELIELLKRNRIIALSDEEEIIADTPVKLMSKIHQLCGGTIKYENNSSEILDRSKAKYIAKKYSGKKFAIYYLFIEEGNLLREYFPNHTAIPEEFNANDDLIFISQVQSGSMGINLATAEFIIMYNISFSSLAYWQSRARLLSKDRIGDANVIWLFAQNGIEEKIFDAVTQKNNYTQAYFIKDYKL